MADIKADLDAGYTAVFNSYKVAGKYAGDLDWLHYAAAPGEIDLTSLWGLLPCVLYFWTGTEMDADSMEGSCRSDKKVYTYEMNCIFEMHDISYATNSPVVPSITTHYAHAAVLETLFNRNTLSVSQGCVQTRMWAGQPNFPGFTMDGIGWIYSINLRFEHLWQDVRAT